MRPTPPRAPLAGTPLGRHTSALGSRDDVSPGGADRERCCSPNRCLPRCNVWVGFVHLASVLWCGSAELGEEGLGRGSKVASGQCPSAVRKAASNECGS